MASSNKPLALNAFKFAVKNINGKLHRINNCLSIKTTQNHGETTSNKDSTSTNFKKLNLVNNLKKKISQLDSDDDEESEEGLSNNVSFTEDDSDDEHLNQSASIKLEDFEDYKAIDIDSIVKYEVDTKGDNNYTGNFKSKQRYRWTHFLSIPLHLNVEFVSKFEFFKKKISEENFADIDDNLFQKRNRLHLTVCLFQIENSKQLDLINQLVKETQESIKNILDNSPLYVDFDQLEIMGTHSKTRVLYTRPHLKDSEKLRDVIDLLLNKFLENNILKKDMMQSSFIFFNENTGRYENEKLHVTLLNSKFLIRQRSNQKENNLKNNTVPCNVIKQISNSTPESNSFFNGLKIIKKMKNFSFGPQKIEELHLNEMNIDHGTDSYKIINKFTLNY